jgi:uncharacterized protein involved in exopolysaccharide biosynthesis
MLTSEYEKARIEEARDTPTVQVLDKAEKPSLRSRPKRKILTLVGGLCGLGWGSMVALVRTAHERKHGPHAAMRELAGPMVGDFSRLRRRRNRS